MNFVFSAQAWDDYQFWQEQDKKIVKRINDLLKDIARNGNEGIGKPEALRGNLQGWTSRRITAEHRVVYRIAGKDIQIAQLRFHY